MKYHCAIYQGESITFLQSLYHEGEGLTACATRDSITAPFIASRLQIIIICNNTFNTGIIKNHLCYYMKLQYFNPICITICIENGRYSSYVLQ